MRNPHPFVPAVLLALCTALPAQVQDPKQEIQEIARQVDEQLKEIDKLLLESGQKSQTRTKQKELLNKAAERADAVDGGLEDLIKKLHEMKNKSSSSGQPEDGEPSQGQGQGNQQQPSEGQQQGQGQARRENQTPEFVQQPKEGEQQGQQQKPQGQKPEGQEQGQGQPKGGKESKDNPENRTGQPQPEPDTGPGQPGAGEGSWGELQPYVNFLKNRGSSPKVPEKYRKYWQAYLKNKQAGDGK